MKQELIIEDKDGKSKRLWTNISPSNCVLSPLNTRQSVQPDVVEKLAERIKRYGFETTRALWGTKKKDVFEIFAGGVRLAGAKQAKSNVDVLEHIGYSEDDLVALSDKDNEDDEYHTKVSPVDVWSSYARLRDMKWTQERIAKAKNVERPTVTWRLKLHDEISDVVKENVRQGLLDEGHLHEILDLFVDEQLSGWITTDKARQELIERTITHIKKNGSKSTKAVRDDVKFFRSLINKVDELYNSFADPEKLYEFKEKKGKTTANELDYDARKDFLDKLKKNKVRTQTDVAFYCKEIKEKISENLKEYKAFIDGKTSDADEATKKQEKLAELKKKFLNADALKSIKMLGDASVRLLLVDPPYGVEFQSNRRWKSEKREKIKGDTEQDAIKLIDALLEKIKTKLLPDAHLLIFSSSKQLCNIRGLIVKNKYDLKGELIWVKEEHGTGDLKGTFAPQHEYIIHATLGRPEVTPRKSTVFQIAREHGANPKYHPAEKPKELLKQLIESTTRKGQLVIDPFAGVASTLIVAMELERDYWGCEIDKEYWDTGLKLLEEKTK